VSSRHYDAIVVGSGPNGLAAAITLAQAGLSVCVYEARPTLGGGMRTAELTLPGYLHDICAAVHPMGAASPLFRSLELERFGLEWIHPEIALAHPFDDGPAATLYRSLEATADSLGGDAEAYTRLMKPFLRRREALFPEILRPIRIPRHPLLMARFGLVALRSVEALVRSRFSDRRARALLAGCAAHAMLPLDAPATASFGVVLALAAHAAGWPIARGGSQSIADALAGALRALGGETRTAEEIRRFDELPSARAYLFDVTPRQLESIAGARLPGGYRRKLRRFRYGPGTFKVDWALREPIPWRDDACRRAGTVHLGAPLSEIAEAESGIWSGETAARPFVLLGQQTLIDRSRVPPGGGESAWAYCHVPHASAADMTEPIEAQIERFAPGFRDLVLDRHVMSARGLEEHNPNMIGGDVGGGANTLGQFLFRPILRWDPYATPHEAIFLASSSTPPGGGVHGMCGYWAARSALRRRFGITPPPLEPAKMT
jgi:phytoene dehydrogenase-like protein